MQLVVMGLLVVFTISYLINKSTDKDFKAIDETLDKATQMCPEQLAQSKGNEG